jgi:hypothetical protein
LALLDDESTLECLLDASKDVNLLLLDSLFQFGLETFETLLSGLVDTSNFHVLLCEHN